MCGYESEEILGQPLSLLSVPDGEPVSQWHRMTEQALRDGLCEGTVAFRRKNGEAIVQPVLVIPWCRDPGNPAGVLIIVAAGSDPTSAAGHAGVVHALRARVEALEESNRAKDRFLGRVLHDIRTPLGGIIGFAATLLMRLPGPLTTDQERQLTTIESCAQDLLSQLDRLPDALRIETGTIDAQAGVMSCRIVVEEVARTWRPRATAKGLAFDVVIPGDDVVLRSDPWIIEQIMARLVDNAVTWTERGKVVVTCDRPVGASSGLRVRVSDTGPGLSPEDQGKLFQPFTQLPTSPPRGKRGSGLGLDQSRKLAQLIGGQVFCTSVPGQGSVFTLIVPEGAGDGADSGD